MEQDQNRIEVEQNILHKTSSESSEPEEACIYMNNYSQQEDFDNSSNNNIGKCKQSKVTCNYMPRILFQQTVNRLQQQNQIYDIILANKITQSGIPNRFGCRIPLSTKWNIQMLDLWLIDYENCDIIEWLTYGFPVSHDYATQDLQPTN